jgi:hypothetical protein
MIGLCFGFLEQGRTESYVTFNFHVTPAMSCIALGGFRYSATPMLTCAAFKFRSSNCDDGDDRELAENEKWVSCRLKEKSLR